MGPSRLLLVGHSLMLGGGVPPRDLWPSGNTLKGHGESQQAWQGLAPSLNPGEPAQGLLNPAWSDLLLLLGAGEASGRHCCCCLLVRLRPLLLLVGVWGLQQ